MIERFFRFLRNDEYPFNNIMYKNYFPKGKTCQTKRPKPSFKSSLDKIIFNTPQFFTKRFIEQHLIIKKQHANAYIMDLLERNH